MIAAIPAEEIFRVEMLLRANGRRNERQEIVATMLTNPTIKFPRVCHGSSWREKCMAPATPHVTSAELEEEVGVTICYIIAK